MPVCPFLRTAVSIFEYHSPFIPLVMKFILFQLSQDSIKILFKYLVRVVWLVGLAIFEI